MEEDKLKRCPCCNGLAKVTYGQGLEGKVFAKIYCKACLLNIIRYVSANLKDKRNKAREAAKEAWNIRFKF